MDFLLPYKVGDLAESRTFSPGFRGAWFRIIIRDMYVRQGHLECLLEYVDFPDEKNSWTRLYKVRPRFRKKKSSESREIMIRPTFPQWYWENAVPDPLPKTDVIAVVTSPWKVGDLIEWWCTDCYWSGKIIKLLGDDKYKIVLHDPPIGEGGCYDADCKDLRPALDWCLIRGWSVPISQEGEKCWYTARLIIQKTDAESSSSDEEYEPSCDREEGVRLNVPSDVPVELKESGVNHLANSNSEAPRNNRDGNEETPKCLNGTSIMPQEVTNSKVDLPRNQNGECSTSGGTDCPNAQGGMDMESSPLSLNRRKISIEPTSVEASTDSVDDNIGEKLANKSRRIETLLSGSAPSNVAKPSRKFLGKKASTKQK